MDFLGMHSSPIIPSCPTYVVNGLTKPIVSRKRMELLSDLSLIPTFFFLGISLKPNLTSVPVKIQFFYMTGNFLHVVFIAETKC